MQRRTLLAALGAGAAGLAGCLDSSTDSQTGDPESTATQTPPPTPTETPPATPTETPSFTPSETPVGTPSEDAFRAAVEEIGDGLVSFSTAGDPWTVEYRYDICCGDGFKQHQADVAAQFAHLRTANVSLRATTTHECQTVEWRVPAEVASDYEAGEIDADAFVAAVLDTTDKSNTC